MFDADGAGRCPGTEPREVCGTPTTATATSGARTVTVTAQDADANGLQAALAALVLALAALASAPAVAQTAVTVTVSAEGNCGGTAANCGASGTRDATLTLDTVRAIQQNAPLALRRGSRAAKGTRL